MRRVRRDELFGCAPISCRKHHADDSAYAFNRVHCCLIPSWRYTLARAFTPGGAYDPRSGSASLFFSSAKTIEVWTCRSGIVQYFFSRRFFSSSSTRRKPCFS